MKIISTLTAKLEIINGSCIEKRTFYFDTESLTQQLQLKFAPVDKRLELLALQV